MGRHFRERERERAYTVPTAHCKLYATEEKVVEKHAMRLFEKTFACLPADGADMNFFRQILAVPQGSLAVESLGHLVEWVIFFKVQPPGQLDLMRKQVDLWGMILPERHHFAKMLSSPTISADKWAACNTALWKISKGRAFDALQTAMVDGPEGRVLQYYLLFACCRCSCNVLASHRN